MPEPALEPVERKRVWATPAGVPVILFTKGIERGSLALIT